MVNLHQAHQHNADDAAEQTPYNEKYKFVHSELLSCQQVLGGSPNELLPFGATWGYKRSARYDNADLSGCP